MSGESRFTEEVQDYIDANRAVSYADHRHLRGGRSRDGHRGPGSEELSALRKRYLARAAADMSEVEWYFLLDRDEGRRRDGFPPLGPGDPRDPFLAEAADELAAAVAAVMQLCAGGSLTAAESRSVLAAAGEVAGVPVSRAAFDRLLPRLVPRAASADLRGAMVRIGWAMLEQRPDLHPELLRRYAEEFRRRLQARAAGGIGR